MINMYHVIASYSYSKWCTHFFVISTFVLSLACLLKCVVLVLRFSIFSQCFLAGANLLSLIHRIIFIWSLCLFGRAHSPFTYMSHAFSLYDKYDIINHVRMYLPGVES